jgi:DNA-binding HxlR family transcriptional regulator
MQPSCVKVFSVLPRDYASLNCSIARTLEILGDRWTLLVVRNALVGMTRFDAFQNNLGLARNVLADRLARLTAEGILERVEYQSNPPRYEYRITDKGRDLWPVIVAIVGWGDAYYAPDGPPRVMMHAGCGGDVLQHMTCSHCQAVLRPTDIATRAGPGGGRAIVELAAVS